jgi:hypothetical protein
MFNTYTQHLYVTYLIKMSLPIDLSSRISLGDKDYNLVLIIIEEAFDLVCKYLKSRKTRGRTFTSLSSLSSYEVSTSQDSDITVFILSRPIHSRLHIHVPSFNLTHDIYESYDYYLFLNSDILSDLISDIKALMKRLNNFIKTYSFTII